MTSRTQFMPSPMALASDVLLWLLLLALLGWGGYGLWSGWQQKLGQDHTLHLAFRDANELSVGSLVRMMGVDIGYVEAIRLQPDFVDVTIRTRRTAPAIPNGARITVLFTGLVGSKNVEIVPPETPPPPPLSGAVPYQVEDPIRLRDTMNYQTDIALALKGWAENFSDFFGKEENVAFLQENILRSKQASEEALGVVNDFERTVHAAQTEFMTATHDTLNTVQSFSQASGEAAVLLDAEYLAPALTASMRYTMLFGRESQRVLARVPDYSRKIQRVNSNWSYRLDTLTSRLEQGEGPLHWASCAETGLTRFYGSVVQLDQFTQKIRGENFQPFHQALCQWNAQVEQWNQKL